MHALDAETKTKKDEKNGKVPCNLSKCKFSSGIGGTKVVSTSLPDVAFPWWNLERIKEALIGFRSVKSHWKGMSREKDKEALPDIQMKG